MNRSLPHPPTHHSLDLLLFVSARGWSSTRRGVGGRQMESNTAARSETVTREPASRWKTRVINFSKKHRSLDQGRNPQCLSRAFQGSRPHSDHQVALSPQVTGCLTRSPASLQERAGASKNQNLPECSRNTKVHYWTLGLPDRPVLP